MTTIELLAPAKDLKCGFAAINCGADAVYIGAPKFGARVAAGNSLADISTLINYAHKYRAKVYVTVNTIIYDDELEEVRNLILNLYEIGADAIIIQDFGILNLDIPPVPLFASTQTNNYSLEKIRFLEEVGFKRIILARELSLAQIKEIRANTSVELEFFVHGALCVSFSGQCYFSYATTGRSANRGECSQPCRLVYSLLDKNGKTIVKNKHLLSLKDLNLSDYLSELIDAGITSFKIEGRLKDISYVKNITAFYRQRLDEIISGNNLFGKASGGKVYFDFTPDPYRTFNRGYTDYFLHGRKNKIASLDTPKSIGKFIGKVKTVSGNSFQLETKEIISNDDGFCFFNDKDELTGMIVNKVVGDKIFPDELKGLKPGTKIYRNRDHQFLKKLSNEKTKRKILAKICLSETEIGITATALDEDNNMVSCQFVLGKIKSIDSRKNYSTIERQLKKSGNSIFEVEEVNINFNDSLFIPIGKLNEIRRTVLELLEESRIRNYPKIISERRKSDVKYPLVKQSYLENIVNSNAEEFYSKHGVEVIEKGFEKLRNVKEKIIMTTKYCIKDQLGFCNKNSKSSSALSEPLFLSDGRRKYQLIFDCKECVMKIKL